MTQSEPIPEHPPPDYHSIPPRRPPIECIRTSAAPEPPSHSSQAFKVNGTIYVAAQIACAAPGRFVIGPPAVIADRIFHNIETILKAAGSSLQRVVKTTVYITDGAYGISEFEAVYKRRLPYAPPRTTVVVTKTGGPDIQMEVIAVE